MQPDRPRDHPPRAIAVEPRPPPPTRSSQAHANAKPPWSPSLLSSPISKTRAGACRSQPWKQQGARIMRTTCAARSGLRARRVRGSNTRRATGAHVVETRVISRGRCQESQGSRGARASSRARSRLVLARNDARMLRTNLYAERPIFVHNPGLRAIGAKFRHRTRGRAHQTGIRPQQALCRGR